MGELGEAVRLYRPLIGWKSTETLVGLDELSSGTYDWDHDIDDERFRDARNLVDISNRRTGLVHHRVVGVGSLLCDSDGVAMGLIFCGPELWFLPFVFGPAPH